MRLTPLRISDRLCNNEKEFVVLAAQKGLRLDGRTLEQTRETKIQVKRVSNSNSLAEATIGDTRVVAIISAELTTPYPDRPSEGFLSIISEVMPCASPSGLDASLQLVEKSLKDSRAIDVEGLCVVAGVRVWSIKCQIILLNDAGSVVDCASLAAMAGLLHFRRPDVTIIGDTCVVHPIEEKSPVALAIHHIPLCVSFAFLSGDSTLIDPSHVEEAVALGMLTVVLNAHKEICASYKTGSPMLRENINQAFKAAVDIRAFRGKLLDDAVLFDPF